MMVPQNEEKRESSFSPAQERLQIGSVALGLAFVFLMSLLVQYLLQWLFRTYVPYLTEQAWYPWMLSVFSMYAVSMPLSLVLFHLGIPNPPEKKRLPLPVLFGLLAFCFGLTYVGNWMGTVCNTWIGFLTGKEPVNTLESMTTSSPFWVNFLCVGILAPVMEELFYRRVVIDRLRRYGELPAILLSGIAFGLIHGNFSQFFYAAMLGMVFGYVYLRTGNILYTIVLHAGINLVGGVYTAELYKRLDTELLNSDFSAALSQSPTGMVMWIVYLVFFLVSCIAAVLSAIWLFRHWYKPMRKAHHPLSGEQWCRVLLLNPGVWIFAIVVLMLFL